MPGKGDERVAAGLLASVRKGPKDVLDLLTAARRVGGAALGNKEGHLHGLIHRLVKRGVLVLDDPSSRGLVRYALPDPTKAAASSPAAVPAASETPASSAPRYARIAARVASGARTPADRGRIVADVLAHLDALATEGREKSFGSARSAHHYLRRADRGRPTVFFTAGAGDSWRRFFLHEGPWLLAAVVVFLVVRAFVAEVFYIPSKSMIPTLEVADRVVVLKPGGKGRPDRWRINTFKKRGITFVKRAVGLGGESISLVDGDVFIDGKLQVKPDKVRAALRFPYETWSFGPDGAKGWRAFPDGTGGMRRWVYDDLLESAGLRGTPNGTPDVPLRDAYAELRANLSDGGEVGLLLEFVDPDDRHLRDAPGGYALVVTPAGGRLERRRAGADAALLSAWDQPTPVGEVVLRLSHVDGVIRAGVGETQTRLEGDVEAGMAVRPAIEIREEGSRPLALRLDRDIHYSPAGHYAVPPRDTDDLHVYPIPDGHVFFLGDNTYDSRDSRFRSMGTVPEADLIGPVRVRIWPPARVGGVR